VVKTFGEYLFFVRKEVMGLTRETFSKGVCSAKELERIEKGIHDPSVYTLNELSKKYNIDFLEGYRKMATQQSGIIKNAMDVVVDVTKYCRNYDKLDKTIKELASLSEEQKKIYSSFIGFVNVLYIKHVENDLVKAVNSAEKYLFEEIPENILFSDTVFVLSDYAMSLMIFIVDTYRRNGLIEKAKKYLNRMLELIENTYLSGIFKSYSTEGKVQRIYQAALYQLTSIKIIEEKYDEALGIVNKAIDFSAKENMSRLLPELFEKKSVIYNAVGNKKEAERFRSLAKELYIAYGLEEIAKLTDI